MKGISQKEAVEKEELKREATHANKGSFGKETDIWTNETND